MERVVSRTIVGLSFDLHGKRLPDDHGVAVVWGDDMDRFVQNLPEQLFRLVDDAPTRTIGDGSVFKYKTVHTQEKIFSSLWVVAFFELACWIAVTGPTAMLESARLRAQLLGARVPP